MYLRRLRHFTMEIVYLTVNIFATKEELKIFIFKTTMESPWNHSSLTLTLRIYTCTGTQ